jgi:hypothetical protein
LDPLFYGSKPTEGDGFVMLIKVRIASSFGGEIKSLSDVVRFYGMLRDHKGMDVFVTERAGTPFRKIFLRRTQTGTAFRNLFCHQYN